MGLVSLLALLSKLQGGDCLTHVGREGTALFAFWHRHTMDDMAVTLAVDLLSTTVQTIGDGENAEVASSSAALSLHAVAQLHEIVRDDVLRLLTERHGHEIGDDIRRELDTIAASLEPRE
jgi:hypothetical protein